MADEQQEITGKPGSAGEPGEPGVGSRGGKGGGGGKGGPGSPQGSGGPGGPGGGGGEGAKGFIERVNKRVGESAPQYIWERLMPLAILLYLMFHDLAG